MNTPIASSVYVRSYMLFMLLMCICCKSAIAQKDTAYHFTGQFTPGRLLDTVFDDHGKKYTLGQISTDDKIRAISSDSHTMAGLVTPSSACGTPGYFKLFLDPASGMIDPTTGLPGITGTVYDDRLQVLCQVLKDISAFINSPLNVTGNKVNVWVQPSLGNTSPYGGFAKGVYTMPSSNVKSGIADNAAWITINSGQDAFTNVSAPLYTSGGGVSGSAPGSTYFDIIIQFNFSGAVTWHTDMTTAPLGGEQDLYGVFLHEIMHSLGFMSLIGLDGRSIFDYTSGIAGNNYHYYSRYDKFLYTQNGSGSADKPLITSASGACSPAMYQYDFNSAIPSAPFAIAPGSGLACAGLPGGATAAQSLLYNGSTVQYVYTPACYSGPSSLSHFDDEFPGHVPAGTVPGNYFIMDYSSTPGVVKRHPTPEERQAMCDIGYSVNTSYGSSSYPLINYNYPGASTCPGVGVAGIDDGLVGGAYIYTPVGGVVTINASDLLSNDYGVGPSTAPTGSVSCIEMITGTGALSATNVAAGGSFTYTPSAGELGIALLRYIPKSSTGVEGNITYVYIYMGVSGCTATPCNLVTNGDFEGTTSAFEGYLAWGSNVPCWSITENTPYGGMNSRGGGVLPDDVHPDPLLFPAGSIHNDHYVALNWEPTMYNYPSYGLNSGPYNVDAITEQLSIPLVTGNTYTINFWAVVFVTPEPTSISFAVSNGPVMIPSLLSALPSGLTLLHTFPLHSEYPLSLTAPGTAWNEYSYTFTYASTAPANQLTIIASPWVGPLVSGQISIFLDDISIVPAATVCPFTVPTMCSTSPVVDLNSFTCGVPGTFSWSSETGGVITHEITPMFNPATAYTYATTTGTYPLASAYTFIDYDGVSPAGCPIHDEAQVHLVNNTAPITGPTSICVGSPTMLSDANEPGGTWTSSNPAVAAIDMFTGTVYGITAGTTTITYNGACGAVTALITILPALPPITGMNNICAGTTTTLSDATVGGTWVSASTGIADVGLNTGVVTGISAGTDIISYLVSAGCIRTTTVTVGAVLTSITGPTTVCTGSSITLSNAVSGGVWNSSNTTVANINAVTGILTGITAGTTTISYTLGGCMVTTIVTVTGAIVLPAITGTNTACGVGSTLVLSDAVTGGVWSSAHPMVATINSATGLVTFLQATGPAGDVITYTVTDACGNVVSTTYTVYCYMIPRPVITGKLSMCQGAAPVPFSATPTGGVWSTSSTSIAIINSSTGVLTAVSAGVVTISYTATNGGVCSGTGVFTFTVMPVATISGPTTVCQESSINLSTSVTGGTWSNDNSAIATINPTTGQLFGTGGGTTTVTYLPNSGGCITIYTVSVTADPTPCVHYDNTLHRFVLTGVVGTVINYNYGGPSGIIGSGTYTLTTTSFTLPSIPAATYANILSYSYMGCTWYNTCHAGINGAKPNDLVVGNANDDLSSIVLVPNPNKGQFTLTGTLESILDNADIQLDVVNMLGQVVYKDLTNVQNGSISKNIQLPDALADGVYIMRIKGGNGLTAIRFILNH